MKKILFSAVLACSLFGGELVYSGVVKPVFLDANTDKSVGRLLPTNGVEIVGVEGNRAKILVKGYQNPASPNVIYYHSSERVIAVAFAKTATPDIKLIKKGENGKWDEVETILYAQNDGFTKDLKSLFTKAKTMYADSCGVCHKLHDENHYKANQWPSLFKSMLSRTAIQKEDEWLVTQYLQKHSSDVK
ncbi:Cytochrome c-type protein TorC [Campylobacter majalis]|uniref:Cytochrome c-type protein TorC n=1 Tax=Campylobacter majalis TaxID=2790656 RepID=A0ABM8Q7I5_9BACT|nr:cytochrome C [Campylobacter majalis]CAD7288842.1 Cytochrome c-type protein TorC [Campylobacter majalis]